MSKQIIFSDEARKRLITGIDLLANSVKVTLGPRGRNVVIGTVRSPFVTNDGVTIAKNVDPEDVFAKMGAKLIRQAAEKTEQDAGDGTTTAIVLTQAIIKEGLKYLTNGVNPMYLKRGLEIGRDIIVDAIKKQSINIKNDKQIKQVATISANNDKEIGNTIGEAISLIGFEGVINVEEAKTHKTTLERIEGMEVERSILSPYFITDESRMVTELEDPYILLVDDKITQLKKFLPALQIATGNDKPILIVAEDIEGEALSSLIVNTMKGTLKVAAIKAPGFGERRREKMQDLAIFTGATVLSSKYGVSLDQFEAAHLGTAKKIISGKTTVIQKGGGDPKKINKRIEYLRERINHEVISNFDKEYLSYRLAKLCTGIAVLKIGASTEVEMKEKRMRVEDALNATKAAIAEGVVCGGGYALLQSIKALNQMKCNTEEEKIAKSILQTVLEQPARLIIQNAGSKSDVIIEKLKHKPKNVGYNAATNEIENLIDAGIIDPTKVVRSALENAISVASIVLTTEVVISPEEHISYYGE